MSAVRLSRVHRWSRLVTVLIAGALTVMLLALLVAMVVNDREISGHRARAAATVLSVSPLRTGIEFVDAAGVTVRPPGGVLYPGLLRVGQEFLVEYNTENPQQVRVVGRSAVNGLVMIGGALAVVWLIAGGLCWWLTRAAPRIALRRCVG